MQRKFSRAADAAVVYGLSVLAFVVFSVLGVAAAWLASIVLVPYAIGKGMLIGLRKQQAEYATACAAAEETLMAAQTLKCTQPIMMAEELDPPGPKEHQA